MQDVVSRYRDWLYATKTSRQAKSNLTNVQPVVLGDLLALPLDKLTPAVLDAWLKKRSQSVTRTTAKRNLNAIKAALNKAVEREMIPVYPLAKYSFKATTNRRKRILSNEEKSRLVQAALNGSPTMTSSSAAIGCLALLCLFAGLRRGEALLLDWSDIDLHHDLIHIRAENAKSAKDRTIPLHPVAKQALERLSHREGPVFPGRHRTHLSEPKKGYATLRKAAGLPSDVTLHILRHSCATELLGKGADLETVRSVLGHADIKTTAIYLHTSGAKLRGAIEML